MEEKVCKPEIQYPCPWQYKAIGTDKKNLEKVLCEVFLDCDCQINYSNSSKTGKYHSYSVDLVVHCEDTRNSYFEKLKASPHVMMII